MPETRQKHARSSNPWTSTCGNIYYRRSGGSAEKRAQLESVAFPTPLIGPRRSRPHAIHIVTFPSGYVPRDLRGNIGPRSSRKKSSSTRNDGLSGSRPLTKKRSSRWLRQSPSQQQIPGLKANHQRRRSVATVSSGTREETPLLSFAAGLLSASTGAAAAMATTTETTTTANTNPSAASGTSSTIRPVLGKLFASFVAHSLSAKGNSAATATAAAGPDAAGTGTGPIEVVDLEGDACACVCSATTTSSADAAAPASAEGTAGSGAPLCARTVDALMTGAASPPAYDVTMPHQQGQDQRQRQAKEQDHHQQQHEEEEEQHEPEQNQHQQQAQALTKSGLYQPHAHAISHPCSQHQSLSQQVISHHRPNSAPELGTSSPSQSGSPGPKPHAHSALSETCLCRSLHPRNQGLPPSPSPQSRPQSTRSWDLQDPEYHHQDPALTANNSHVHHSGDIDQTLNLDQTLNVDQGQIDTSASPRSSVVAAIAASMATRIAPPFSATQGLGGTANTNAGRNSNFITVRPPPASTKSSASSIVSEVPKPVASGSGVSCSILLAEPTVFLSGFDHDSRSRRQDQAGTALLRGKLRLSVTKNVKIKAVQLKLVGRARTEWPEGIPPLKQDVFEEESLRTQVLTFFNAMYDGWESDYGNQCTYRLKESSANSSSTTINVRNSLAPSAALALAAPSGMNTKDLKRLSMQNVQSRSFGKGDNPGITTTTTQAKGFKVFYPGNYDYSFELPIDHHQLETAKLQFGSVKWELHATVDRAGAFKPNLHGTKEVSIVRVPDQLSLEMSEPISISRQWEDQLHYDIVISGKSFPIGGKIPIAFKLTPLAKVQVHKLRVYVTESIEYWTNDRRVTRRDPGRKILLLEKAAGKPLDDNWATSDLRTLRGGELTGSARREARELATQRRAIEASRRRADPEPLPEPSENLLGDLDLGLESYWGSTEIEANIQLPTCEMMAKNKELTLHPDCSWKNVNVYHWIKIVLRLSRIDPEDPTGKKRRHFEISIDSPFTVLNCRAIQANTNLPAYSNPVSMPSPYQSACGCPDAASIATISSPNSSTGTLPGLDMTDMPAPPQAAHIHNPGGPQNNSRPSDPLGIYGVPRPMHLMRVPSFNPPAFDEDTAPPPLSRLIIPDTNPSDSVTMTPPPQYDVVVGTPSVDGMADYFARLADYGYDEEDSGSDDGELPPRILGRSGRVNVAHPRTPGGRMPSRSMELARRPTATELDEAALSPTSPSGASSWSRPPPQQFPTPATTE